MTDSFYVLGSVQLTESAFSLLRSFFKSLKAVAFPKTCFTEQAKENKMKTLKAQFAWKQQQQQQQRQQQQSKQNPRLFYMNLKTEFYR